MEIQVGLRDFSRTTVVARTLLATSCCLCGTLLTTNTAHYCPCGSIFCLKCSKEISHGDCSPSNQLPDSVRALFDVAESLRKLQLGHCHKEVSDCDFNVIGSSNPPYENNVDSGDAKEENSDNNEKNNDSNESDVNFKNVENESAIEFVKPVVTTNPNKQQQQLQEGEIINTNGTVKTVTPQSEVYSISEETTVSSSNQINKGLSNMSHHQLPKDNNSYGDNVSENNSNGMIVKEYDDVVTDLMLGTLYKCAVCKKFVRERFFRKHYDECIKLSKIPRGGQRYSKIGLKAAQNLVLNTHKGEPNVTPREKGGVHKIASGSLTTHTQAKVTMKQQQVTETKTEYSGYAAKKAISTVATHSATPDKSVAQKTLNLSLGKEGENINENIQKEKEKEKERKGQQQPEQLKVLPRMPESIVRSILSNENQQNKKHKNANTNKQNIALQKFLQCVYDFPISVLKQYSAKQLLQLGSMFYRKFTTLQKLDPQTYDLSKPNMRKIVFEEISHKFIMQYASTVDPEYILSVSTVNNQCHLDGRQQLDEITKKKALQQLVALKKQDDHEMYKTDSGYNVREFQQEEEPQRRTQWQTELDLFTQSEQGETDCNNIINNKMSLNSIEKVKLLSISSPISSSVATTSDSIVQTPFKQSGQIIVHANKTQTENIRINDTYSSGDKNTNYNSNNRPLKATVVGNSKFGDNASGYNINQQEAELSLSLGDLSNTNSDENNYSPQADFCTNSRIQNLKESTSNSIQYSQQPQQRSGIVDESRVNQILNATIPDLKQMGHQFQDGQGPSAMYNQNNATQSEWSMLNIED